MSFSEISEILNKLHFLTVFRWVYRRNNLRIGFLVKFCVDGYVSRIILSRFSWILIAFDVRFVYFKLTIKIKIWRKMPSEGRKLVSKKFWWHTYYRKRKRITVTFFFTIRFFFVKSESFQIAPIGLKLSRKMRLGESFRMVPYTRF